MPPSPLVERVPEGRVRGIPEQQMKITTLTTHDLRFPTSASLDGSDAMNPDPDYSAAYVVLGTDGDLEGHGLTFTMAAAMKSSAPLSLR